MAPTAKTQPCEDNEGLTRRCIQIGQMKSPLADVSPEKNASLVGLGRQTTA
jgi:hypothetical protein